MKLYTEEQIRKAMVNWSDCPMQDVIDKLNPIEIPSDEEIEKIAIERFAVSMEDFGSEKIDGNEYFRSIFIQGIECLREKIQGGNK